MSPRTTTQDGLPTAGVRAPAAAGTDARVTAHRGGRSARAWPWRAPAVSRTGRNARARALGQRPALCRLATARGCFELRGCDQDLELDDGHEVDGGGGLHARRATHHEPLGRDSGDQDDRYSYPACSTGLLGPEELHEVELDVIEDVGDLDDKGNGGGGGQPVTGPPVQREPWPGATAPGGRGELRRRRARPEASLGRSAGQTAVRLRRATASGDKPGAGERIRSKPLG
jgi:hypothetical protein